MILEKINNPAQIKQLNFADLKILAKEVRKRIVEVGAEHGGHIAPSLGTVDFTIALLKVFSPPEDAIVWDVGHQSYAWKILTGRNDRFDTIRQFGGLSGFTNRDESPYDAFSTGHSSTSISAALGIACGRDMNKQKGYSIAVIGDGALTGGMSFEALNHGGHLQKNKFIVILNDNTMSISKNVGGLQKYMAHMLVSKSYNSLKKQIWDMSEKLPSGIRRRFIIGAQKLEESMINILVPNILFEDLGFKYVGPIDGHDIMHVTHILHRVKENMVGPVLIHLVTQKGKGYDPAERNASLFHGIGPFDKDSGKPLKSSGSSWSETFGDILCKLAGKNDKIVAITAAMSVGTGLSKFEKKYPQRFYDVGIAEQHAVTFAAGLATRGIKPFLAIYSTFLQRSLDQIIHDVALPKLPVVFCIDRAGFVGEDGATHHGAFDISFLSFIPNMVILAPATADEFEQMLSWAAEYVEGPVAIRYPRGSIIVRDELGDPFALGKAEVVRNGLEIALIATGTTLGLVEDVAAKLIAQDLNPYIINIRSIKPLDLELLQNIGTYCHFIFTFEDNALIGGLGSHIQMALNNYPATVYSFGYPDNFVPHGNINKLNQSIGFTADALTDKVLKIIH